MSKAQNNNTELEVIETSDFVKAVQNLASLDLKKKLKNAKVVMSITKEYLTLEQSKPKRFVFCGICKFEKTNKETAEITSTNAVTVMDENKKMFIGAQTSLVQSLIDLPVGTAIEITQLADKKLDGGRKLAQFEVILLGE